MSDLPATRTSTNADAYRGLRVLALIAVATGVVLLAAAAFALSYAGIHAIALQAGVSARLARLYPLIFDAMLVVAGASVLSLRGAGLVTRCYAWLTMLALLAAAGGADALHATGTRLPHRSAAATVAIIPWALVLIGFGLLLAMLRHARLRRAAVQAARLAAHGHARAPWEGPAGSRSPSALPPGETPGPAPRPAAAPVAVQASALVLQATPAQTRDHIDPDDDPIRNGQHYRQDASISQAQAAGRPDNPSLPADPSRAADPSRPGSTSLAADAGLAAHGNPAAAGSSPGSTSLAADPSLPADPSRPGSTSLAADAGLAGHGNPAAAGSRPAGAGLDADTDLAVEAEADLDDPTSDEARALGRPATPWVPRPRDEASAGHGDGYSAGTMSPAPTPDPDDDADPGSAAMPQFDRMQSSPTPPEAKPGPQDD